MVAVKLGYYIRDTGDGDVSYYYFMNQEPPDGQYKFKGGVWKPMIDGYYLMDKIIDGDPGHRRPVRCASRGSPARSSPLSPAQRRCTARRRSGVLGGRPTLRARERWHRRCVAGDLCWSSPTTCPARSSSTGQASPRRCEPSRLPGYGRDADQGLRFRAATKLTQIRRGDRRGER